MLNIQMSNYVLHDVVYGFWHHMGLIDRVTFALRSMKSSMMTMACQVPNTEPNIVLDIQSTTHGWGEEETDRMMKLLLNGFQMIDGKRRNKSLFLRNTMPLHITTLFPWAYREIALTIRYPQAVKRLSGWRWNLLKPSCMNVGVALELETL